MSQQFSKSTVNVPNLASASFPAYQKRESFFCHTVSRICSSRFIKSEIFCFTQTIHISYYLLMYVILRNKKCAEKLNARCVVVLVLRYRFKKLYPRSGKLRASYYILFRPLGIWSIFEPLGDIPGYPLQLFISEMRSIICSTWFCIS